MKASNNSQDRLNRKAAKGNTLTNHPNPFIYPDAQSLIDEVQLSDEDQADLNISKICRRYDNE